MGMVNKAVRLESMERSAEAVEVYDELLARFGDATESAIREQVAAGMVNKGYRLEVMERSAEAVEVYDELVARFGDAEEPGVRAQVETARQRRAL